MAERFLIVNADDFGQSDGINTGVITSHDRGIVTSASLMVRWPAAVEAARLASTRPALALGLHVDLAQWTFAGDEWRPDYEVVGVDDAAAVEGEVGRQLDIFRALVGVPPTHLDGHQHVQRSDPVGAVLRDAGAALGVPVRLHSRVRYCGSFYGQTGKGGAHPAGITVAGLLAAVDGTGEGWTELGCHPGLDDDAPSSYRVERRVEVATLCEPAVRAELSERDVVLRSFAEVPPAIASRG